jgi:hypothetical protein
MPTTDGDLTAAELAQLLALVQAQAAIRAQITQIAVNAATSPLAGFTAWWETARIAAVIGQILRILQPAQRRMAQITDAYLARAATIMTGRTVRPVGAVDVTALRRALQPDEIDALLHDRLTPATIEITPGQPRRDDTTATTRPRTTTATPARTPTTSARQATAPRTVDPAQVYGRIADAYRYQVIARGLSEQQAQQRALQRTAVVAEADVMLAARAQARRFLTTTGARGYRRILHPELSTGGSCGLCVVAADRVYRIEQLMPIHDRCKCEVLPIIGRADPGLRLNRDDLDRLYGAAGGTTAGAALKRVRVAITEHGELGPVLVYANHTVRGPKDVAATQAPDRATRAAAQLAALEQSYAALLHRQDHGEDVTGPLAWQRNRIAELHRDLAA